MRLSLFTLHTSPGPERCRSAAAAQTHVDQFHLYCPLERTSTSSACRHVPTTLLRAARSRPTHRRQRKPVSSAIVFKRLRGLVVHNDNNPRLIHYNAVRPRSTNKKHRPKTTTRRHHQPSSKRAKHSRHKISAAHLAFVSNRAPPKRPQLTCAFSAYTTDAAAAEQPDAQSLANDTCLTPPGGKCFSLVQDYYDPDTERMQLERMYGCLPAEDDGFLYQCGFNATADGEHLRLRPPPQNGKTVECCDTGDLCNSVVHPAYVPRSTHMMPAAPTNQGVLAAIRLHYGDASTTTVALAVCLLVAAALTVFGSLVWSCFWCRSRRRRRRRQRRHGETVFGDKDIERSLGGTDLKSSTETVSDTATACAPSAIPPFIQRTIGKDIQLECAVPLGAGRFGDVWLAQFHRERVAVKVHLPAAQAVCLHEEHIYRSAMRCHENIQRFIGSYVDVSGRRALVTHYHELGTVHTVLAHAERPLRADQLARLAYSLAAGLGHLHTEICGLPGKPAIAHGSISARNLLVRRDWQCVIADFALAVQYVERTDETVRPPAQTMARPDWRYVAPELLADTMAAGQLKLSIVQHQSADMYAAGLVWWQMARCCATRVQRTPSGPAEEIEGTPAASGDELEWECEGFAMPYETELRELGCAATSVFGAVPRRADMRRVVCASAEQPVGRRPAVPERWRRGGNDEAEVLRALSAIMTECWYENGAKRLTALRVKKSLGKLRENPVE